MYKMLPFDFFSLDKYAKGAKPQVSLEPLLMDTETKIKMHTFYKKKSEQKNGSMPKI